MTQPGGALIWHRDPDTGSWEPTQFREDVSGDWRYYNDVGGSGTGGGTPPPPLGLTYETWRPSRMGAALGMSSGLLAFMGKDQFADWCMKQKRAGIEWVRWEVPWVQIQPTEGGAYNWDAFANVNNTGSLYTIRERINILEAFGLRALPMFMSPPSWAQVQYTADTINGNYMGHWRPVRNSHMDEWGDFILAFCQEFPSVKAVQIWNEPNQRGFWQNQNTGTAFNPDHQRMVDMCAAPRDRIRAAGLDVVVVGPGLASAPFAGDPTERRWDLWYGAAIPLGILNAVDHCGLHGYEVLADGEVDDYFKQKFIDNGKGGMVGGVWQGMQVWGTEDGLPSRPRATFGGWIAGNGVTGAAAINTGADDPNNDCATDMTTHLGRWWATNDVTGVNHHFSMVDMASDGEVNNTRGWYWRHNEPTYQKMLLDSSGVVLQGDGTVTVDTSINQNFTSDSFFYSGDKGTMLRWMTGYRNASLGNPMNGTV